MIRASDSWPERFCACGDPVSKFTRKGKPRRRWQYMKTTTCDGEVCLDNAHAARGDKSKIRKIKVKSWRVLSTFDIFSQLPVIGISL
jgi:hypothetical protein